MNAPIPFMLAWLNGWEILAILVVVLVLFGAKKLPELAKGLGQGIKEFKKSSREITDELQSSIDMDAPPPAPRPHPSDTQARTPSTSGPVSTPAHSDSSQQPKP
ncbi:MAG: twin-arginine translocase TatA/TatE family subunit [Verrucomicrobiota bacterium]|nr:twin-arginine translocase TatA/TatE family subunit [Verrucomicrobiota bacterium]